MAKIKITRGNGEDAVDCETSVIVAVTDDGDNGTKTTVVIEGGSSIEIAAAIKSLEEAAKTMKERYPSAHLLLEFYDQMKELEKEDQKKG